MWRMLRMQCGQCRCGEAPPTSGQQILIWRLYDGSLTIVHTTATRALCCCWPVVTIYCNR